MCDSANPYYAPTSGKHMSFGNGPAATRSDIEDDIRRNVTWRTDEGSDDEERRWTSRWDDSDRDRYRSSRLSSSPRLRASWRDRPLSSTSTSMGWQRRSSTDSYRRNLSSELSRTDSARSNLSSSYRIPRTSRAAAWDSKGSSTRRDSMHDSYHGRTDRSASRSRGGGMSATWAGGRGR